MILFKKDWNHYPNAIIDLNTSNKSFLRMAGIYKAMGIENNSFMLSLLNPELSGVNPFSEDLSPEQMLLIAAEAKSNPWYFIREIARIPISGAADPIKYKANRANLALTWLFYNHITLLLMQPRQTGKSVSTDVIMNYIRCVSGLNTTMFLFTRNDSLRVENVKRIRELENTLPYYLRLYDRKYDSNNLETLTCYALKNKYLTAVGQMSKDRAINVGRGMTLPIIHVDEIAFIDNNFISLPAMLPATTLARDIAEENNAPYGNIFTTTAGFLNEKRGLFVYEEIYNKSMRWSEKLLDCNDLEELKSTIKANSPRGELQVLCEFNHRQLGYTDEWLKEKIMEAKVSKDKAETEFLLAWSSGNEQNPIDKETLKIIHENKVTDPITVITSEGFAVRWYVPQSELDNKVRDRKLVMGLDTSEAIGGDYTCMVIMDAYTGETVATGKFNSALITTIARWITNFLLEYENILLIPEKRSTGTSYVDFIIEIFMANGKDPFKRIFNWLVNDMKTDKRIETEILNRSLHSRDNYFYAKYKKYFGYATAGTGRTSRSNLYGETFTHATKYLAPYIRDVDLINELSSLIIKNGRLDHPVGGHDDMVISWSLAWWALTKCKNISYYGIDPTKILKTVLDKRVEEYGGKEVVRERQRQLKIRDDILKLIEKTKQCKSEHEYNVLVKTIERMSEELTEVNNNEFNVESIIKSIKRPMVRLNLV
jgi:hypothetical protein